MRAGLAGLVLAVGILMGGTAMAADCKPGAPSNLYPLANDTKGSTAIATRMMILPSLTEGLRSEADIRALPRVCERGAFDVGSGRYRIFGSGGDDKVPARYAVRDDGKGPVLYLAPLDTDGRREWLLAITDGDVAAWAAGADGVPTDDQVVTLFGGALRGDFRKAAGKNLKTGAFVIYASPAEPPKSASSAPTPAPGTGPGQPMVLDQADGTIFLAGPNGEARHALTGMVCPTAFAGFQRDRMVIFDATGGGRDVSCRFSIGRSYFTLYLTRYPERMAASDVFSSYSGSARSVAPAVRDTAPPLPVGKPPLPLFEDFWVGTRGQVDGLWMVQIGQWYIKVRATYDREDEAAIRAAAKSLFEQVHASVKPPEV